MSVVFYNMDIIKQKCDLYCVCVVVCIMLVLYYFGRQKRGKMLIATRKIGILITGCDTGIGYSLAIFCHKLGLTVFAGCLNINAPGPSHLRQYESILVIEQNVTDIGSVKKSAREVEDFLNQHPDIKLKILVNNAGKMVFGEFHWYTDSIIEKQIGVNLIGPMYVTKIFAPFLFNSKGRIINIISHCAFEGLPGLSVYSATKAGVLTWTNALRIELEQYGIQVVSFIPGSFYTETNILSYQKSFAVEMKNNMSNEDWLKFKDYFEKFNLYLSFISPSPDTSIEPKVKEKPTLWNQITTVPHAECAAQGWGKLKKK